MSLKLRAAAAVVVALGIATTSAEARRPDFSGTWLLNVARSAGLRDDERKGVTLLVRQSDREIVFERTLAGGGQPQVVRYALDGSESTSQVGNAEIKARSRWDADKLVTEGTQEASLLLIRIGGKFKEVRYVTADNRTMVVESTIWRGSEQTDRKLVFNRRAE